MECTTHPTTCASCEIELRGVYHDQGRLVCCLHDGSTTRMLVCRAADLQTFARFQRLVADKLGIWIDHYSQQSHRASTRREGWNDAVAEAFRNGGAK
jgi:hypothetical protein